MHIMDELQTGSIYVTHALKGYEYHEKRVIELFKKNQLNFQFVTDGDPIYFTDELLTKYFTPEIKTALRTGTLSCTLNHILTYEKIVASKKKYALVFEDDPFFLGDFVEGLNEMTGEIMNLEKGFIISLENSSLRFPSYWQASRGKYLYPASKGRMAGAYLIDLAVATRILEDIKQNKCHTIIDWWHNSLTQRGVVKMYWAQPPLVEQGSHNGRMSSTNSTQPSVLSRRIGWWFQKNYKYYIRRLFKEKRILVD